MPFTQARLHTVSILCGRCEYISSACAEMTKTARLLWCLFVLWYNDLFVLGVPSHPWQVSYIYSCPLMRTPAWSHSMAVYKSRAATTVPCLKSRPLGNNVMPSKHWGSKASHRFSLWQISQIL